jgi:hypothetical protein
MPSAASPPPKTPERPIELFDLDELEFDLRNPRYGAGAAKITTEREALDHIVSTFGVSDVLSSISVNGFFDSEPLVGIRLPGRNKVQVVEGNRRLAACLILANDERAKSQTRLHEQFAAMRAEHASKRISPVPVIVYEGKDALKEVLPYIGVRHIVGFLEWDSYAKAAWVDGVLGEHQLTLREVQEMVGDKNDTIPRMLGGFRFVNQLVRSGHFRSDQSQRKGRGSNPDYPFSWIYTALDNLPVKEFVGFQEEDGVPAPEPVPQEKLEDAGLLLTFMFGDKNRGIAAVVEDSRELGDLAKALKDPQLRNRLKEGKKLRIVIEEARPSVDRLHDGFQRIADQLRDMSGLIVPGALESDAALGLVEPARLVANLSKKVLTDLRAIAAGTDESEDE